MSVCSSIHPSTHSPVHCSVLLSFVLHWLRWLNRALCWRRTQQRITLALGQKAGLGAAAMFNEDIIFELVSLKQWERTNQFNEWPLKTNEKNVWNAFIPFINPSVNHVSERSKWIKWYMNDLHGCCCRCHGWWWRECYWCEFTDGALLGRLNSIAVTCNFAANMFRGRDKDARGVTLMQMNKATRNGTAREYREYDYFVTRGFEAKWSNGFNYNNPVSMTILVFF